jgi:ACR3 family arsenite efflux pump ArsB
MSFFSKLQPICIIGAALTGILIGQNALISANAARLIEVFLMSMLFVLFSCVNIREITKSFSNVKFSVSSLLINFVWTPIFAFLLGKLFLGGDTALQTGFLMLMVTPCTDWYLIFTGMGGGNVPLGASILPMNLILQVSLLPVYLWLFMGSSVSLAPSRLLYSVVLVLIIPMTAAYSMKWLLAKINRGSAFQSFMGKRGDDLQLMFLCLAIISMFASQGRLMLENYALFARLFVPLILFFTADFGLALFVGGRLKMPFADRVSLLFTTSARNSPISLAVAVAAFPHQTVTLLALIIGPLIELPILALAAGLIRKAGKFTYIREIRASRRV